MSYLDRLDLASGDDHALDLEGLGRGASEGHGPPAPMPAAHFISKGFSRGAAPDNLVFLPARSAGGANRSHEYVCPSCGDVSSLRDGEATGCLVCGAARGEGARKT